MTVVMSIKIEYDIKIIKYKFKKGLKMSKNAVIDTLILNLVQKQDIKEQTELQEILKKHGYDVPQATLSRRLKHLKVAKVGGVYKIVEFSMATLPPILGMKLSDFGLIVLHTYPGHANSLAYYIDQKYVHPTLANQQSDMLGTIAGDDTVVIIARNKEAMEVVVKMLKKEFQHL